MKEHDGAAGGVYTPAAKKDKANTCTYMPTGIGEGCQDIPHPMAGTAMWQAVNKQQYARAAVAVPHAAI